LLSSLDSFNFSANLIDLLLNQFISSIIYELAILNWEILSLSVWILIPYFSDSFVPEKYLTPLYIPYPAVVTAANPKNNPPVLKVKPSAINPLETLAPIPLTAPVIANAPRDTPAPPAIAANSFATSLI